MSLEEQIVEWSAARPPWQRAVLRRIAVGDLLTDKDYDELVNDLLASKPTQEVSLDKSKTVRCAPGVRSWLLRAAAARFGGRGHPFSFAPA